MEDWIMFWLVAAMAIYGLFTLSAAAVVFTLLWAYRR
jgi:hypothetical protein